MFSQQGRGQRQRNPDAERGGDESQARSDASAPITDAAASEREEGTPNEELLRLLLCVDDGRLKATLKQEMLRNINDDRELFTHLRQLYFIKRGWLTLRSIGTVSLAQVSCQQENQIFIDID